MSWTVVEIWKDHTYPRGVRKGETHRAVPLWSDERGGYDLYDRDDNQLCDAEVATSLDELYISLGKGWRVRCIVPTVGETSILTGPFQARFKTSP